MNEDVSYYCTSNMGVRPSGEAESVCKTARSMV